MLRKRSGRGVNRPEHPACLLKEPIRQPRGRIQRSPMSRSISRSTVSRGEWKNSRWTRSLSSTARDAAGRLALGGVGDGPGPPLSIDGGLKKTQWADGRPLAVAPGIGPRPHVPVQTRTFLAKSRRCTGCTHSCGGLTLSGRGAGPERGVSALRRSNESQE